MASGHPTDKFSFLYQPESCQNVKSKGRLSSTMNPVYSPVQPGTPYGNPKNMAYTGYPGGYPTTAPTYTPNLYQTGSPGYPPVLLMKQGWAQTSTAGPTEGSYDLAVDAGSESRSYQASSAAFRYTAGTPYKVPPTQTNGAPPPYSPSPNPYQTAMYPIRSAYPQQNLYAQVRCLLHTACVCCSASCHPPHHGGPTQQHPLRYLPQPCPHRSLQWCGHGHGGWHHYGHVSRDSADHTTAHTAHRRTPSYRANIQASRNTWVQLCASSLVNPPANSYLESNIVCNFSSLTLVLGRQHWGTKSVCKNKKYCKGHFCIL